MDNQAPISVKKKILVVEDERFLRDLYVQILTEEGYLMTPAEDGEEALKYLQEGGFDLVLLDIMLPKLNGIEILRKLKGQPPLNPNKEIVLLTNLGQDALVAEGISLGVRGYLIKSDYTPDQIIAEVKKILT